ncbi:acetate kinase [bacterium]|nr:acetate kinase [bacterium]
MNVLVINCGSSSLKYQLFEMPAERLLARGLVERIGAPLATFQHEAGDHTLRADVPVPDHAAALERVRDALLAPETGPIRSAGDIGAIGHRVVHGGEAFTGSVPIDEAVIATLEQHSELAPLHNPPNLVGIRSAALAFPGVPQVGVFDTAFHQTLPRHAYLYALPYELYTEDGVRRYGFHGTSHRFVSARAAEMLGIPTDAFNAITCHLGNGCSMAAIAGGKSVDTSLGLTPLEGLVMGTRSGDFDPAILFYLARRQGLSTDELDAMVNTRSGLLGLSGVSNDMRELLEAAPTDPRCQLAIDVFCYRVRKYIGAYLAVLGRADALVFTGGIGENAPAVRHQILEGLDGLGLSLDAEPNRQAVRCEADVASPESPIRILVVPTNEELMIARDTLAVATLPPA